jgi:hypothetical protein
LEGTVGKGSITHKSKQICVYGDGIVVIANNITALTEVSMVVENEADNGVNNQ